MIKPQALTSLSIFFPCYNEEGNIGAMIEQAEKTAEEYGVDYEIVVVDDGSRDRSAEIIGAHAKKNPRVRLISHERNMGYGAALRTGLSQCQKELVFLTDGDQQFRLQDIEKLFSKIDSCDVVAGYRISRNDKAHRRVNGFLWTRLSRTIFGIPVRDVDCAFKLFRKKCLKDLNLRSDYLLIHAEILARLKKKGYRIQEIGIPHYPRTAGQAHATKPIFLIKSFLELVRLYWTIRSGR